MKRAAAAAAPALALLFAACRDEPPSVPFCFTNVAPSCGIDLVTTSGAEPSTQIVEVKGGGVALIDVDADGDYDVFVPNGATLDDPARGPGARLFENRGGLAFAERAVDFARWSMGVAVGDVDGDGYDDAYVTCFGPDALLRNRGGTLAVEPGGDWPAQWTTGCAFGDLDADGDLDLYVAGYLELDPAAPPPMSRFLDVDVFAGPRGLPPVADRVYANRGDGTFEEITASAGFDAVEPSFGLGAAILDFDLDGRQDVFVGNDSQPNFLFLGRADGPFEEAAFELGLATNADGQGQATMGIAIGDVNADGAPDVLTTNFANDTNTLHQSRPGGGFEDATRRWGVGPASRRSLGWAAGFFDFDHDGDEDLLVLNGHVYPSAVTEQLGTPRAQTPLLFAREPDRFVLVEPSAARPWLAAPHVDRGAAFGDLDGDGDVDFVVTELNGAVRVMRNDLGPAAPPALVVRLLDERPGVGNRRGLGSRIELLGAAERATRWIASGTSYLSASAPQAWFALPPHAAELTLVVTWSDGTRQEVSGVSGVSGTPLTVHRSN